MITLTGSVRYYLCHQLIYQVRASPIQIPKYLFQVLLEIGSNALNYHKLLSWKVMKKKKKSQKWHKGYRMTTKFLSSMHKTLR